MTCRECDCAKKGFFTSAPNSWVCIGVKEPFIINDLDVQCTEYEELRNKQGVTKNRSRLSYGVIREYKDGTTLWYEPLTDRIYGFVLRASDGDVLKLWTAADINRVGGKK